MYKPCAALTAEEVQEVHRYFLAMARYERRAAAIAEALALHIEGKEVIEGLEDDASP